MQKLINYTAGTISLVIMCAMAWAAVEGIPSQVEASIDATIENTYLEHNPLQAIRPQMRPNLWQRSSEEERECMALNIYHEARGEIIQGQIAVAQVTLNRVELDYYPDTICGVVWDRYQFSWTFDGRSDAPTDQRAWVRSQIVAQMVMETWSEEADITGGADHYHAHWVNPDWADENRITYEIGVHTFYDLL